MKALTLFLAAVLSVSTLIGAEENLIGHWDFADAKDAVVPGKVGPAAKIILPGKSSTIIQQAGKTMLKVTGDYKKINSSGGLSINKMPLDPSKPFSIIFDFYFEKEGSRREFKEFCQLYDGDKKPGFRVFYSWDTVKFLVGDGQKNKHIGSSASAFRMPVGRVSQMAIVYDGKTASIYVDAKRIAHGDITVKTCRSRNLLFGSFRSGRNYPLSGALGNIKVYNKAFSALQIAEKYLAGRENQE